MKGFARYALHPASFAFCNVISWGYAVIAIIGKSRKDDIARTAADHLKPIHIRHGEIDLHPPSGSPQRGRSQAYELPFDETFALWATRKCRAFIKHYFDIATFRDVHCADKHIF